MCSAFMMRCSLQRTRRAGGKKKRHSHQRRRDLFLRTFGVFTPRIGSRSCDFQSTVVLVGCRSQPCGQLTPDAAGILSGIPPTSKPILCHTRIPESSSASRPTFHPARPPPPTPPASSAPFARPASTSDTSPPPASESPASRPDSNTASADSRLSILSPLLIYPDAHSYAPIAPDSSPCLPANSHIASPPRPHALSTL